MMVGKNISTTSGLGNCSKSSNRDPGLNQAFDEGSDFESEANSRPDLPGEQKTKEDEPPSKMQKIDPTNSGTGTLHLNEQRPKSNIYIYIYIYIRKRVACVYGVIMHVGNVRRI